MKFLDECIRWEKYLKYLKDFAEQHEDSIWIGLSPFTYMEWKINENKKGNL